MRSRSKSAGREIAHVRLEGGEDRVPDRQRWLGTISAFYPNRGDPAGYRQGAWLQPSARSWRNALHANRK